MSESVENVCEICSQEISEDNRASSTNDHTSNTDVERVICNECFRSLHGESSKVKLEEVPITLIEFNTDIPKIVEVPCKTIFNFNQCGYSTIDLKTLAQFVVVHLDNHGEVSVKEEVSIKDEGLEDISLELVEINTDIHKIIEEPCETNFLYCYYCGYSTTKKTTLIKHLQRHQGNGVTSLKCDVNSSAMLSFHLKNRGKKRYNCDVCDYSSAQSCHLKQHMQTHTGEKPYKCKLCDYSSVTLTNVKRHMYIHTGEKPYKCKVCNFSSVQLRDVKRHMLTHTGEKPYKCKVCDHSSARLGNLKRHMLTHTGEKPYKCKLCYYSAATSMQLKQHMYTHTGEKPYKCKVCDYSSARLSNLKVHILTHTD